MPTISGLAAPSPTTLETILEHKRQEVAAAKAQTPLAELEAVVAQEEPPRNFFRAVIPKNPNKTSVIAEIKRQSPSAGLIRPEYEGDAFKPEDIARQYHAAGASAISCLTDQ